MAGTVVKEQFWVQLAQSNMRGVLNMAKMAKLGFLCTTTEETLNLFMKSYATI
jgi:hypothetical protein